MIELTKAIKVDTRSPVSLLNWATTKEIIDKSNKARFIPSDKLNSATQFVDYNKQPICVLGALKTNLRPASLEVKGATFLVTERKTKCTMGLDLLGQVGIATTQEPAPRELFRVYMLMCEQTEGWKNKFFGKISDLFDGQGISKKSHCKFKIQVPSMSDSRKREKNPISYSGQGRKTLEKLLTEGHITKLDKCTSDCFIAPIVITVKKDDSKKIGTGRSTDKQAIVQN